MNHVPLPFRIFSHFDIYISEFRFPPKLGQGFKFVWEMQLISVRGWKSDAERAANKM